LAKAKESITSKTCTTGTLKWTAPEILTKSPKWSEKADIYSLGMVFFEIVSCELPFKNIKMSLTEKIVNGTRPELPKSCTNASNFFSIQSI
jgi:serine/threonine protein kinase